MKPLLQVDYIVKKNFISQTIIYIKTAIPRYQFELTIYVNGFQDYKKSFNSLDKAIGHIFEYIEKAHDQKFWEIGIRKMIGRN